jgi:hypothetical protein
MVGLLGLMEDPLFPLMDQEPLEVLSHPLEEPLELMEDHLLDLDQLLLLVLLLMVVDMEMPLLTTSLGMEFN